MWMRSRRPVRDVRRNGGQAAAAQAQQATDGEGQAQPEGAAVWERAHRDPVESVRGEQRDR